MAFWLECIPMLGCNWGIRRHRAVRVRRAAEERLQSARLHAQIAAFSPSAADGKYPAEADSPMQGHSGSTVRKACAN